jgi:hypothetical protein
MDVADVLILLEKPCVYLLLLFSFHFFLFIFEKGYGLESTSLFPSVIISASIEDVV